MKNLKTCLQFCVTLINGKEKSDEMFVKDLTPKCSDVHNACKG